MTMTNKPFVIWTVQRTGSTSLANILQILSDRTVYHEPFNSDRIFPYNGDPQTLTQQLETLKQDPICFKHCWNVHPDWCNQKILEYVLEQGYLVLFLHRSNMLKVQLSKELAQQTGIWGKKEKDNSTVQLKLKPVDIIQLKNTLNAYKHEIDTYRNKLQQENFDFLDITFEDFFDDGKDFSERLVELKKVCRFLQIPESTLESDRDNLYKQLVGNKQNTVRDYEEIPNIQAIKLEFPGYRL